MKYLSLYLSGFLCLLIIFLGTSCNNESANAVASGQNSATGKGGSMARFTIVNSTLYVVDQSALNVFSLNTPNRPEYLKQINLGFGVETIYPYQNNLFIGTQTGMYILDNQDVENPKVLSTYQHIRSCDPVVVQGKYAYVTMRAGTNCNRGLRQLDVVDISDLRSPKLVKSYPMTNPYGLGIDGNSLFVCDNGLKFFDVTNPTILQLTNHISEINGYDVIPNQGTLLVTGSDGLFQYDYKGNLVSKIPITK